MNLIRQIGNLVYQKNGPLTRELMLEPAKFGLGEVPKEICPDAIARSVCGFCSTGCNLKVHLKEGQAVNMTADQTYPVNRGMACPKGWEALSVTDSPSRGTTPLLKGKNGKLQSVDWNVALTTFVDRLKAIQKKHGNDSVSFLGTGQITTEELAFLGSLAKFGMGMVHGDGNTRQCMATAVAAYKESFGFDAPPYTYKDLEESDVIVFVGANPCIAHPILWERVMSNRHDPQIVVIDPRTTETAMNATLHLPLRPKSDLTLFYGLANRLIEKELVDTNFIKSSTSDFDAFSSFIADYDLDRVVRETGIAVEAIEELVDLIGKGKRVSFWWTMGVNQSHQGVRTAQSIINLALLTGNIGRPGTGANSITGQCNAMGSRLFSNTTSLLGGRNFENQQDREQVAQILEIDPGLIPARNSLPYHKIMDQILKGKIKGLWVICTNPAHSWINQIDCRDILSRLDFLVVQDIYHDTETVKLGDLYLPAAGWGEKEGTFINSERRIGRIKKVKKAPGQALSDFNIFKLVAKHWGCDHLFEKWKSPESVFQILKQLSADQPCDISGINDYQHLEDSGGIQWPCTDMDSAVARERRLFEDGKYFHADHKARFCFAEPRELPEQTTRQYPFTLLTGRGSAAQWHTQTRTRCSEILKSLSPSTLHVEINPTDARRLGIAADDHVMVESQRGRVMATAFLTHTIQPAQVFLPMHFATVNQLTFAAFDPISSQPAYKACAVRVYKL